MLLRITDRKKWTLFLDRDGVINKKLQDDYVKNWQGFEFLPGVIEALSLLKKYFDRIIVITNQQGIGKELMSEKDLKNIHKHMCNVIENGGGRIDRIYFCPDVNSKNDSCRKPGIKMAMMAKADFPEIDFQHTIMIGDSITDMKFGRNIGALTVFISNNKSLQNDNKQLIDYVFNNLNEFAKFLYDINH